MAELKQRKPRKLTDEEKAEGKTVLISTEPVEGKYGLQCVVEINDGEKCYFNFNGTTYDKCFAVFGSDSVNWVGKELISLGKVKCGAFMAFVWKPKV